MTEAKLTRIKQYAYLCCCPCFHPFNLTLAFFLTLIPFATSSPGFQASFVIGAFVCRIDVAFVVDGPTTSPPPPIALLLLLYHSSRKSFLHAFFILAVVLVTLRDG
jgi:hypothetical protein